MYIGYYDAAGIRSLGVLGGIIYWVHGGENYQPGNTNNPPVGNSYKISAGTGKEGEQPGQHVGNFQLYFCQMKEDRHPALGLERAQSAVARLAQAEQLRTVLDVTRSPMVDFSSNDYLSLVRSAEHQARIRAEIETRALAFGATGARMLTGHSTYLEALEAELAEAAQMPTALVLPSGYAANLALLGTVGGRGDTYIYDAAIHASLRDGIRLSPARAWSFRHNDLADCEQRLRRATGRRWLVVESVYSMDGDLAPLAELAELAFRYDAPLIVDEAHGLGILGTSGMGLVGTLPEPLRRAVFACTWGFGKALGAQGGAVLGCPELRQWVMSAGRAFLFTTAPAPAGLAAIRLGLQAVRTATAGRARIQALVGYLATQRDRLPGLITGPAAIQGLLVGSVQGARSLAGRIRQELNTDVRAIVSPTVAPGTERLRICLHAHNTQAELEALIDYLTQ
jgi:8-amino-7-oxononanoate synthase